MVPQCNTYSVFYFRANFHRLSNWQNIFSSENFLIYGNCLILELRAEREACHVIEL